MLLPVTLTRIYMTNRHPGGYNWLLVLTGAFFLVFACSENEGKTERAATPSDSLQNLPEEERRTSDSLRTPSRAETADSPPQIYFGKEFREIEDPVSHVKNALQEQPELISLDPVLGGKTEFRQITVLTEEWLLAYYDDGHIQGKAIYEYKLLPDQSVEFEELVTDHQ